MAYASFTSANVILFGPPSIFHETESEISTQPYFSITALKGEETMSSVGFALNGTVKEVDLSYLDKIYDQHPEMLEINKTDSERRKLLRPFEITPTDGFVYDLWQMPIFQKAFTF